MIDYLLNLSTQPTWIFVGIILASYVLEDIAIVGAAILAVDQLISVPLAGSAIMIGIISGDIGLYTMGYIVQKHPGLKQWLVNKDSQNKFTTILDSNLIKNILFIRFVPGLRFVCYTSCGLFNVNFKYYVLGISLATSLWVMLVFTVVFQLGSNVWTEHSQWKWLLVPLAMVVLYFSNRQCMRNLKQA